MKPHVWMNKRNGDFALVVPWYMPQDMGSDIANGVMQDLKIGAIVQVGWMLQNGHDVYFGVGPKAANEFEDLGEL